MTSDQNICQGMMITVVSLRLKFEVLSLKEEKCKWNVIDNAD